MQLSNQSACSRLQGGCTQQSHMHAQHEELRQDPSELFPGARGGLPGCPREGSALPKALPVSPAASPRPL